MPGPNEASRFHRWLWSSAPSNSGRMVGRLAARLGGTRLVSFRSGAIDVGGSWAVWLEILATGPCLITPDAQLFQPHPLVGWQPPCPGGTSPGQFATLPRVPRRPSTGLCHWRRGPPAATPARSSCLRDDAMSLSLVSGVSGPCPARRRASCPRLPSQEPMAKRLTRPG